MNRMMQRFLDKQRRTGAELSARSDLVEIAWPGDQHVLVHLDCTGLVRSPDGRVVEHSGFDYGVHFAEDHLRYVNGLALVTLLAPVSQHHPNVQAPGACIGHVERATELSDIVFRLFDLTVFNSIAVSEQDALNPRASRWARERMELFPVDARPVLWRRGDPVPLAPGAAAAGDWGMA